jgi:hypothetical protein
MVTAAVLLEATGKTGMMITGKDWVAWPFKTCACGGRQPTAGFDFAQPARDQGLHPERVAPSLSKGSRWRSLAYGDRVQSRTVQPFQEIALLPSLNPLDKYTIPFHA